jgi:hypothetical protein
MKESISFSESQAIIGGTDERAQRQELDRLRELNCRSVCVRENAEQRQETEELRDLCDNQARIIESMQESMDRKVIQRDEWKRIAKERGATLEMLGYRENAWSEV